MTDDEVKQQVAWEVGVSGGRLAMLGATDQQICRGWIEALRKMDAERAFPIMFPYPTDTTVN